MGQQGIAPSGNSQKLGLSQKPPQPTRGRKGSRQVGNRHSGREQLLGLGTWLRVVKGERGLPRGMCQALGLQMCWPRGLFPAVSQAPMALTAGQREPTDAQTFLSQSVETKSPERETKSIACVLSPHCLALDSA